jgi:hypothetical protein
MEIGDIFNYFWSLATFRNLLAAILMLPLLTLVVMIPFSRYFSKEKNEWLSVLGYSGLVASGVLAVETLYRTVYALYFHFTQKPKVFFDNIAGTPVSRLETFDYTPLVYLIILVVIAVLSGVFADFYSPAKNDKGNRKQDSDLNTLKLKH